MHCKYCGGEMKANPPTGKLETCRYKLENGTIITKMFSMGGDGWDIDDGWHESPKAAKAAVEVKAEQPKPMPKTEAKVAVSKIDKRTKAYKALKAVQNGDSTGTD